MKKNILILFLILIMVLFLTACNGQKTIEKYDSSLASYLLQESAVYYGEGQYYHEIQNIEISEQDHQYLVNAFGEIKDNSIGRNPIDFNFNYRFIVTDSVIIQEIDNPRLNDSDFKAIELLKLPLEVGNTWTFDAVMFNNKTTKMTGEIISLSDDADEIKVRYTSKDYVEMRIIKKGQGVTDFTKEIVYKDVKAISGYHLDQAESKDKNVPSNLEMEYKNSQNEVTAFEALTEASISPEEYELIQGFNQNYALKIRLEENHIFDYVMPESPGSEKIDNLKALDVGAFKFIQFKAKAKSVSGESVFIDVLELYELSEDQFFLNTMTYTMKMYGDKLMIYDFK